MLSKVMYTREYIRELHARTGSDPSLLEKMIFAFGLLEAIKRAGLSFCFKGGTSLMLLLEHPRRLSTDIDIIAEPGVDLDAHIRKAGEIFPFIDAEEHFRAGKNNIEKRHFRFKYQSPESGSDVTILLDVLLEKVLYEKTEERPIKNELLLTEGEDLSVTVPNVNGILGDKLTAFAPHTTGILFGKAKEMEIIKQLFDCGVLFDVMTDYKEVCAAYDRIVKSELAYRGLTIPPEQVLEDTVRSCLCIVGRGAMDGGDYTYYRDGISRIRNHILGGKFSGDIAGAYACRVLYLASSMLTKQKTIKKIDDAASYAGQIVGFPKPKCFSYLRIIDPIAYGYVVEAARLLQGTEFADKEE